MINFKFELVKFEKLNAYRLNYEFKVELNHSAKKSFKAIVKYGGQSLRQIERYMPEHAVHLGTEFVPNQGEETLPYPGNLDTHMLSEALRIYCNGLRGVPSYIWIGEVGEYVGESV